MRGERRKATPKARRGLGAWAERPQADPEGFCAAYVLSGDPEGAATATRLLQYPGLSALTRTQPRSRK